MYGLKKGFALSLAGALALAASSSYAAGLFTNGVPTAGGTQYPSTLPLTGNETIPADTNLPSGLNPASEAVSVAQLQASTIGLPSRGNALIGGDGTTNLWQRGTAGTAATTTVAYGSADRWASWSGLNTEVKVIRDSTAADLPTGYQYAIKMQRTSGQTGVVQTCMAQEVESVNSYQFAGGTAELDFHAATGANFSAANSRMTAYVITGTGTDEGMAKLAFGLNAGGGGSTAWTGQANATAAVVNLQGVSKAGRYSAVASIPAGTTEIGVALCFTPVGTAGTNDYIAFDGIQLIRNPANAAYASATVGYNDSAFPAASFDRRLQGLETLYQLRYTDYITEDGTVSTFHARGSCEIQTTSIALCMVNWPVTMRAAPTVTYTTGFAALNVATAVACTGNTTSTAPTGNAANTLGVMMACASSAGFSAASTAAIWGDNASGAGVIKASAEL